MTVTLKGKILDYARDRNDFFCVHDLEGFFDNDKKTTISGLLSLLTKDGSLTMTDEKQSCKMQMNKHRYYIYNKKPVISNPVTPNNTPVIQKVQPKSTYKQVEDFINGSKGDFCSIKLSNILKMNRTTALDNLKVLSEKGILARKPEKERCKESKRSHIHYIHNPHEMKPVVPTKNKKTQGITISINEKITIDLNVVKEGACVMVNNNGQKLAILREDNKIKIFKVME